MRRSKAAVRRTAIHEAGHAVAAEVLRLGCDGLSIVPNPDESEAGHCIFPIGGYEVLAAWEARGRQYGRYWAQSAGRAATIAVLAGVAAEREMLGRAGPGAGSFRTPGTDRRLAALLIDDLTPTDGDVRRTFRSLDRAALGLVRRHRKAIVALADELVRQRQLSGNEVARIVAAALTTAPATCGAEP